MYASANTGCASFELLYKLSLLVCAQPWQLDTGALDPRQMQPCLLRVLHVSGLHVSTAGQSGPEICKKRRSATCRCVEAML